MFTPRLAPACSLLLLLVGCSDGDTDKDNNVDDTATGTDDSGDDTAPQYEAGCILVDGAGGYAWLTDAVAVASEGSVITLCEGSLEESVTVDKGVTITGPGSAAFTLTAPTNMTALTITASNVTVTGITIASTRTGIEVSAASDVSFSDIVMSAVDNYGINAEEADNLMVTASSFSGVGYGAIQASGGSLTVDSSTFTDNASFAIHVTDSGELVATGNTITGTLPIDPEAESITDGHGIWLVESNGTLSNNVLTNNFFIGAYADTGDLSLSGDSISGSLYGAVGVLGDFTVDGVTATDNVYVGLLGATYDTATITNTTVSGDPTLTVDVPGDDWGDSGLVGTGILLNAVTIDVSDTTVTGYNDAGLYVGPFETGGDCDAKLARVTLTDNGRIGLYASEADLSAEEVNVSGVIEVDDAGEEQCYSVGVNAGVTLYQSSASWTGGSVMDNDGYGIASVYSVLILDGATVGGNSCAGVMNFGGTMQVTDNTFSNSVGNSFAGSVVSYEGSEAIITDNLFTDAQTYREYSTYEYDDGAGNIYEYHYYHYDGSDVQLWYGGDNEVIANTFEDGSSGVQVIYSDAAIEENTWSNYAGDVLYAYGEGTETVSVKDNTIDGFGGYGVYCGVITMEVENLTLINGGSYTYGMEAFLNDEPYYSYTSTYAQPVLYGYDCAWSSTDTSIETTDGHVAFMYGGTWEFEDFDATDVGNTATYYDTVQIYGYYDTEVWFNDARISDVAYGAAIGVSSMTTDISLALHLDDVTISGTADNGVTLETSSTSYAVPTAELSGVTIEDVSGYGVYLYGATATVDDSAISGTGSSGIYASSSTLTSSLSKIIDSGAWGIYAASSAITLTGNDIEGSAYDGVYLSGTTGTVTGNTVTSNGDYGMECSSASFDACSNDLSGNTTGDQYNCDAGCAIP